MGSKQADNKRAVLTFALALFIIAALLVLVALMARGHSQERAIEKTESHVLVTDSRGMKTRYKLGESVSYSGPIHSISQQFLRSKPARKVNTLQVTLTTGIKTTTEADSLTCYDASGKARKCDVTRTKRRSTGFELVIEDEKLQQKFLSLNFQAGGTISFRGYKVNNVAHSFGGGMTRIGVEDSDWVYLEEVD